MKALTLLISILVFATACGMKRQAKLNPTFNERMYQVQVEKAKDGQDPYAQVDKNPSADVQQSSLWSRSQGSPHLIRNQKAQHVGDLLTVIVDESATATTSAKTDTKREGTNDISGTLAFGKATATTVGTLGFESDNKNEFKGSGSTDRSGKLRVDIQAVVEGVLPNGTLFVRGEKVITINNEDQEVEISGFVRPDDIRINNTVLSSLMADAKIRYMGDGVISDKQRVGWGTRLLDAIWPF